MVGAQSNASAEAPNRAPGFGPSDWRTAAALALVFLVFYAGFTHAKFKSTDSTGVFAVTESLYERHTLEVPVHRHAHLGAGDTLHAPFAIGQSVLALPLYALAKGARAVLPQSWSTALAGPLLETKKGLREETKRRLAPALRRGIPQVEHSVYGGTLETFFVGLYAPILSALLAMGLFVLLRRLEVSPRIALLTTFLICVCSYPATMSVYFLRHTSETVSVVFAFVFVKEFLDTGRTRALALGCTFASLTFLVRFPGVLAGPAIGVYVLHGLWQRRRVEARPWLPDLLAVSLPLAAALMAHVGLNYLKWGAVIGSPMVTGGLETSNSFGTSFAAFLLSPGISVFAYSPLLLLLPWTLRAAWRRWPWECVAFLVYGVVQLLFFSNYRFWTGLWSSPGPRYLFPAGVFLLVPMAAWLETRPRGWARRAWVGLAALGAASQFVLLTANWSAVMGRERYTAYDPQFSFLFLPHASPILASGRAVADGVIDTWLWKLASGWQGQDPAPLVAVVLAFLWISASVSGAWWIWRRNRDHFAE